MSSDLLVFLLSGLASLFRLECIRLLVNCTIQKHRQDDRGRTVDGHGHRGIWSAEVEAVVQNFYIVQATNTNTRGTHFAVNVRPVVGIIAIQSYRIKGSRKPLGFMMLGK